MMIAMFAFESSVNSNQNFKLLSRRFHLFEHDIDSICKQSIKLRNLGFSSFFPAVTILFWHSMQA